MIINLWECLVALRNDSNKVVSLLEDLSRCTRWDGQELSLESSNAGWIIKVFSCYGEGYHDSIIEILIPKDNTKPAKILKDRNGRWEYHHDQ